MSPKLYEGRFDGEISGIIRKIEDPRKRVLLRKLGQGKFSSLIDDIDGWDQTYQLKAAFEGLQEERIANKTEISTETAYITPLGEEVLEAAESFEQKTYDDALADAKYALNTEGGVALLRHLPNPDFSECKHSKYRQKKRYRRFSESRIEERLERFLEIDAVSENGESYERGSLYEPLEELLDSVEDAVWGYYTSQALEFIDVGEAGPKKGEIADGTRPEEKSESMQKNPESVEKLEEIRSYREKPVAIGDGGDPENASRYTDNLYDLLETMNGLELEELNSQLEEDIYLSRITVTGGGDTWAKDVEGLPYILEEDHGELDRYVLVRKTDRNDMGQPYGEVIETFSEEEIRELTY